ncbi:hypothetical protein Tco_0085079 [Tanacetum coccineum]
MRRATLPPHPPPKGELNVSVEEKDSLVQEAYGILYPQVLEFCNREFEAVCMERGLIDILNSWRDAATEWGSRMYEQISMDKPYLNNWSHREAIEKKTTMGDAGSIHTINKTYIGLMVNHLKYSHFAGNAVFKKAFVQRHVEDSGEDIKTRKRAMMKDAGDHETDQTPDLTDYQLARDRRAKDKERNL